MKITVSNGCFWFLFSESADENEESIAEEGRFFDSCRVVDDVGVTGDLPMTTITMTRSSMAGGRGRSHPAVGFLRGIGGGGGHHQHQQHVTFDPEAPPPPTHHQTTCLLEKPEVDKKVKVLKKKSLNTKRISVPLRSFSRFLSKRVRSTQTWVDSGSKEKKKKKKNALNFTEDGAFNVVSGTFAREGNVHGSWKSILFSYPVHTDSSLPNDGEDREKEEKEEEEEGMEE